MADIEINFTLQDNSEKVLEELQKAVQRALIRCGQAAEGYAKDLVPVNTGLLRNSITYATKTETKATIEYTEEDQKEKGQGRPETITVNEPNVVYIGTNVFYAPYVELGTGKYFEGGRPDSWGYVDDEGGQHWTGGNQAKPFLQPAITRHKQTYRNIIEDELKGL